MSGSWEPPLSQKPPLPLSPGRGGRSRPHPSAPMQPPSSPRLIPVLTTLLPPREPHPQTPHLAADTLRNLTELCPSVTCTHACPRHLTPRVPFPRPFPHNRPFPMVHPSTSIPYSASIVHPFYSSYSAPQTKQTTQEAVLGGAGASCALYAVSPPGPHDPPLPPWTR